ncbi:hypothetical protein ABWL39_20465 [Chitinivorax sp. PXF-14]|uniref:hypothetical protein n=1 Tax=Chitinivorax sp. PXF-14 TaxID=3230488 RepID=UPI00346742A2
MSHYLHQAGLDEETRESTPNTTSSRHDTAGQKLRNAARRDLEYLRDLTPEADPLFVVPKGAA